MKKNLLLQGIATLVALLFLAGCRKETRLNESLQDTDENNVQARSGEHGRPECRLTHLDYGTGYTLDFKYNSKGLASEVLLSFSDGYFERHKVFYDRHDRLVKTQIITPDLPEIEYIFYHSGGFITRARGYFRQTHEPWRDIRYSYNRKGQMIKLDDVEQDVHVKYAYNNQGYNTHDEFYLGDDLFYTYDFAFRIPNKNPYLAINGIPFGFWDFLTPLWDKRWESYDRYVLYEDGTPTVILDTDPAQTTMVTGQSNYLLSATKYDLISESFYTESMEYRNCGGGHHNKEGDDTPPAAKQVKPLSPAAKLMRILSRPSKDMKQQMSALARQVQK